jgi:hypothetical protein
MEEIYESARRVMLKNNDTSVQQWAAFNILMIYHLIFMLQETWLIEPTLYYLLQGPVTLDWSCSPCSPSPLEVLLELCNLQDWQPLATEIHGKCGWQQTLAEC